MGEVNRVEHRINLGCWGSVFAVPSDVVDRHLKLAGETALKTLLYLLRHSGQPITDEQLAQELSLNKEEVADALVYWTECKVLSICGDELLPADNEPAKAEPVPVQAPKQGPTEPAVQKKEKITYDFTECAQIIDEDKNAADMLSAVSEILAKNLTHREICSYVTLYHWYGMPAKVVPLLAHYCKMLGRTSTAYVESVGIAWTNDGIDTQEKAEERIKTSYIRRRAWRRVSDLLELAQRKPTDREERYCEQWIEEWAMPSELIKEAYERCINAKGKLSFSYINGILARWNGAGIRTLAALQDAEQAEKQKEEKGSGGRYAPTHDLDEIEAMLWEEELKSLTEDD